MATAPVSQQNERPTHKYGLQEIIGPFVEMNLISTLRLKAYSKMPSPPLTENDFWHTCFTMISTVARGTAARGETSASVARAPIQTNVLSAGVDACVLEKVEKGKQTFN